jgi:NitT/TauT family transport system substrate-binding protein
MRKLILATLAILLAAPTVAPAQTSSGNVKKITLLANYTFHGRHSPFFVALDKGYLKEAGFDADIQPATGSGFVISAIEGGKADYGLADASVTVQSIAKGAKVKGFHVFMDVVTNGLAALKPYPTPDTLLNRSIASAPTDSSRTIVPIILKSKGLDPSKVNWVAASPATYFTLLLSGQVDIISATIDGDMPPLMEVAKKDNKEVHFSSFGDWGYDVLGFIFVAKASTLEKDPEGAKNFVKAMNKAVEFSIKDPEAAASIMVKHNPTLKYDITLAQWKQSIKAITTPYMKAHGYGVATPDRVQRTIDLIKTAFNLDINLKPEDVWNFDAVTH